MGESESADRMVNSGTTTQSANTAAASRAAVSVRTAFAAVADRGLGLCSIARSVQRCWTATLFLSRCT